MVTNFSIKWSAFAILLVCAQTISAHTLARRQLSSLVDSVSDAVSQISFQNFGSSLTEILNSGVSLADCLEEIKESAGYTEEELEKFGQTLRILKKLAKYKYLGQIDTSLLTQPAIIDRIINATSELSPCSNALYQGDVVLTTNQMNRIVKAAMDYCGVSDLTIFNEFNFDLTIQIDVTLSDNDNSKEKNKNSKEKNDNSKEKDRSTERRGGGKRGRKNNDSKEENAGGRRGGRKHDHDRRKRKLTNHRNELWEMPITYRIETSSIKELVKQAISEWEEQTCITFQETTRSLRLLRGNYINFKKGQGCHSNVGKKVKTEGQTVSLGPGCEKKFIAVHEIGHALGLWHEQARPDRDSKIEVKKENVAEKYLGNFLIQSADDVDTNVPYDLGSVMHYGSTAFASEADKTTLEAVEDDNQLAMGQRKQMSFYDVKAINTAYCSGECSTSLNCLHNGYTDPKDCTKCRCPQGFSGTLCDEVDDGSAACGEKDLKAESGMKTLSVSGQKKCYWRIKADGGKVSVKFDSINFACFKTCKAFVELKFHQDLANTGHRFCCKTPEETFSSETEEMIVIYDGGPNGELTLQYGVL